MKKFTIGIDVGGTNIKLGIVNPQGKIIGRGHLETSRYSHSKTRLIDALVASIRQCISDADLSIEQIAGIGIGVPGLVHFEKGIVKTLTNIPGWRDVPLASILKQKLHVPIVVVDNDVNVITLAEWEFGAGKGCRDLVCMTLGTGVGGGLIFNNALYRGPDFVAGEIGHMVINEKGPACNCGGQGCFETYVGNRTLLAQAARIFKKKDMRIQDVFALANQGNVRAIQFWNDVATHIGHGLVGVVNLLNPRLIIIGGGVSNNHKYLFPGIRHIVRTQAMKVQAKKVRIVRAKLGDDAGIIGAQVLVKEKAQA